ncbi:hypothetical protein [Streptomyces antibioticus]|uniref:hypothetical protein n=1 Tax=Streptomyces antibioticus TaxID=1890 RepID=UPI0033CB1A49
MQLPKPHEPFTDSPELMEDEKRHLAACELAIDHLRLAFWAAGKALAVISEGRLYRATHATFEDYVEQRWEMSRAQAYRLMDAWPLAERLGTSPIGDKRLTESQVRALLPAAKRHGDDVAAEVYRAVVEASGRRVTARLLAEAAEALPSDGESDPAEAVRAYLSQDQEEDCEQDGQESSAVDELAAEVRRMTAILRRVQQRGTVERAAAEDAEAARRILGELAPFASGTLALGAAQD